jgi:hypothetical protein
MELSGPRGMQIIDARKVSLAKAEMKEKHNQPMSQCCTEKRSGKHLPAKSMNWNCHRPGYLFVPYPSAKGRWGCNPSFMHHKWNI